MTTVKTLTLYHACFKFGASRVGATSLSRVRPVDSYLMLKLHANWPSRTRDMMIQSCVALWPAVFTGSSTTYLGVVVVDGRILYVEHPPPNGEIPTHLTPITAKLHQLPCWWAKRSTWENFPWEHYFGKNLNHAKVLSCWQQGFILHVFWSSHCRAALVHCFRCCLWCSGL